MASRPLGMAPAMAVLAAAFAAGVAPSPQLTVAEWAEQHRVVPDKSAYAGKWRNDVFPPLVEIMDRLSPHDRANRVTVLKAAQMALSEVLANVAMTYVDIDPCDIIIVHPTRDGVRDWDVEKFQPAIDATARVKAKIRAAKARDGEGSTNRRKRFLGGDILLLGANSAAGLRQHSCRVLLKDDWSGWPLNVDGQGDPDRMAEARLDSWRHTGRWKAAQISTPTIVGSCRTTKAYDAADHKGRWLVACPDCGHEQELRFFPDKEGRGGLRYQPAAPHDPHYVCAACGSLIPERDKNRIVRAGRWTWDHVNLEGTHWAFRLSKVISPSEPWEGLVAKWVSAQGDPEAEKAFWNLDLGEAWEEKGDAPAWELLKKRAEPYPVGRILPPGAWLVTIGCDVQGASIYYEAVAWGPGRESWSVDAGQIIGDTAEDPATGEVWRTLAELYHRQWRLPSGREMAADMMAIDAGFNTDQVVGFTRGKPYAMAVKGAPGWDRAVFAKAAARQDKSYQGKVKKRGAAIWPVHVWSLKGELYANLRKEATSEGLPPGYCHFPESHPDAYYQQLTADYLHQSEHKGRLVNEWRTRGENHWHDCRIYARAALYRAEQRNDLVYGDAAAWARLIARRGGTAPAQGELPIDVTAIARAAPSAPVLPQAARPAEPPPPAPVAVPSYRPPAALAARRVVRNSLARVA